jgi:general secretion pathway protein K|tara:strand:- start:353 stop:1309 length:957 start_codon:yes stop_codon:yes gene_type:complete
VALVAVLLMVAIAVVVMTSMANKQNLAAHKTLNHLEQSQAFQYALGGEELARQILHDDFEDENKTDHMTELWAVPIAPYEFEQGEVEIQITDLQSLFNLNSLAVTGTRGNANRLRFEALLAELAIDSFITDLVADWMDDNQSTRQLGAEDYDYLDQNPPYRTGTGMMADVSELRLLLEMDEEDYRNLLSYVVVLPDGSVPININTAPAIMLQSIATDLTLDSAEILVEQRDAQEGYQSVDEFLQQQGVTGAGGIDKTGLSVRSQYFRVASRARYNDRVSKLTSIIQRDPFDGQMRVLSRDLGQRFVSYAVEDSEQQEP